MGCQQMSYVTVMTKFIDKVTLFEQITQATSVKEVDGHLLQLVYSRRQHQEFYQKKHYAHMIFKFMGIRADMKFNILLHKI